ncbi:uncharacterized protein LOC108668886 [Hyalella azteca]|uniref:Uncharacterized protein LOC108668886 n=1 Tax=Hyalella azteca TaxID=294128 RepID=A0A8B7NDF9_HYAAZ|nr:uncharacterized protein LOC108668886 [Hyalella azteca]
MALLLSSDALRWKQNLLLLVTAAVLWGRTRCYVVQEKFSDGRWQSDEGEPSWNDSISDTGCRHGRRQQAEAGRGCHCYPCWSGSDCNTYVDNYAPRFLVHRATAVVPVNVTGSTYRAWALDDDLGLTCPLGPGESARCPCASFTYQLFSPSGDHRFALHPSTGLLVRRRPAATTGDLQEGKTYKYKLMVQSVLVPGYSKERLYDILDLEIFVGPANLQKTPWI